MRVLLSQLGQMRHKGLQESLTLEEGRRGVTYHDTEEYDCIALKTGGYASERQ